MAPHGRGSERDGCGDRLLLERRIGSVATGDRPNILFFLTEDLSWNLVSHMTNVQAMQKKAPPMVVNGSECRVIVDDVASEGHVRWVRTLLNESANGVPCHAARA